MINVLLILFLSIFSVGCLTPSNENLIIEPPKPDSIAKYHLEVPYDLALSLTTDDVSFENKGEILTDIEFYYVNDLFDNKSSYQYNIQTGKMIKGERLKINEHDYLYFASKVKNNPNKIENAVITEKKYAIDDLYSFLDGLGETENGLIFYLDNKTITFKAPVYKEYFHYMRINFIYSNNNEESANNQSTYFQVNMPLYEDYQEGKPIKDFSLQIIHEEVIIDDEK